MSNHICETMATLKAKLLTECRHNSFEVESRALIKTTQGPLNNDC